MPLYSDLSELKALLDIDPNDKSEDVKLNFFNEFAANAIEELLNRPGGVFFATNTQYYKGKGTQKLLLRRRPAYPGPVAAVPAAVAMTVITDPNGNFGSTSGSFSPTQQVLTYGVDYCLQIDQDDGGSRSGLLIRLNNLWDRPYVRKYPYLAPFLSDDTGSIQVTYSAGYTVDTLPASLRMAADLLVANFRYVFPLGMGITSDGYEDRNIGIDAPKRAFLLDLIKPLVLSSFANWKV